MSQQHQNNDSHLADFTGIILILTFVVIFAVISSGSQSPLLMPAVPTDENQEVAAQVAPTNTVAPTSTPLPPTATATSTPTITSEPTTLPSSTPPAATVVQESAIQGAENVPVGNYDPVLVEQGKALFALCAACHGPEGYGIPNLGKDLIASEFVHSLTDEDLLTFIKTGRPIWDPLNTTGLDMPSKGGNPALSDDEIMALIAYIRSLSSTG